MELVMLMTQADLKRGALAHQHLLRNVIRCLKKCMIYLSSEFYLINPNMRIRAHPAIIPRLLLANIFLVWEIKEMVYILMHLLNLLLREAFNDPEFSQEFVKNKIVLLMKLYAVEPIQSLLKTTEAALPAMISVMKTRDDLDIVCAHSFFYGDEAEFRQKREDYRKSVLVQSFHIERMEESVACLNFLFSLSVGTKYAVFPKPDMDEFIATLLNNLLLSDWIRDENLLMTINFSNVFQ